MRYLGTAKRSHRAGTAGMKQIFAKQELFSVLCIKNSCEPGWTGGVVVQDSDKACGPKGFNFS